MKNAFTMIELVFVIVVLGILAVVAIPRMGEYVEDAKIASGKSAVSSIRSAIINERQNNLIKGNSNYPGILDDATTAEGQELFDGNTTISILTYPIYSKNSGGGWMKIDTVGTNTASYEYYISNARQVTFNYTNSDGKFDCIHGTDTQEKLDCKSLAE